MTVNSVIEAMLAKYNPQNNEYYTTAEENIENFIKNVSEKLSDLVKAIIDNRPEDAKRIYLEIKDKYPIAITRDLNVAKNWAQNCR